MENLLFVSFHHSYLGGYEIVYHCGFDLHFLSDRRSGTFYVLSHAYMFWGQKPIEIICPFSIIVFFFLFFFFLGYESPLYFLGTRSLQNPQFMIIVSLYVFFLHNIAYRKKFVKFRCLIYLIFLLLIVLLMLSIVLALTFKPMIHVS